MSGPRFEQTIMEYQVCAYANALCVRVFFLVGRGRGRGKGEGGRGRRGGVGQGLWRGPGANSGAHGF